MNMIEKVARTFEPRYDTNCSVGPDCPACNAIRTNANKKAKAAIEAMREPSEEMKEAIDDSYVYDSSDLTGAWYIVSADPETNWKAGIDAALKEE